MKKNNEDDKNNQSKPLSKKLKEKTKLERHELAVQFADEHVDLDDDKFWKLARKQGLTEADFYKEVKEK